MMQTLDVISVNIWQILISLANLLILFMLLKHFLYKPVKNIIAKRQSELDARYNEADAAVAKANESKQLWDEKIAGANAEADSIIKKASEAAQFHSDRVIADAKNQADGIIKAAKLDAELERRNAEEGIKREIVEVSGSLTEKMLGREIKTEDHRALIDSFIKEIGEAK